MLPICKKQKNKCQKLDELKYITGIDRQTHCNYTLKGYGTKSIPVDIFWNTQQ